MIRFLVQSKLLLAFGWSSLHTLFWLWLDLLATKNGGANATNRSPGVNTEDAFLTAIGNDPADVGLRNWQERRLSRENHPDRNLSKECWGLYDMHGNVWERCQDWYGEYTINAVVDPQGPNSGQYRVLRGGSWIYHPKICRAAVRGRNEPGRRSVVGLCVCFCLDKITLLTLSSNSSHLVFVLCNGGKIMILNLPPQLEAALAEQAQRCGVAPEVLAVEALRERFLPTVSSVEPRDDWKRRLFGAALDCGVSVPDSALSSDGLYE